MPESLKDAPSRDHEYHDLKPKEKPIQAVARKVRCIQEWLQVPFVEKAKVLDEFKAEDLGPNMHTA